MKIHFSICLIFLTATGISEDLPVASVKIEPISLEIKTGGHLGKGSVIRFHVPWSETDNARIVSGREHLKSWNEDPSRATVSLIDSKGKDLGKIIGIWEHNIYDFTFQKYPSPGAEWVRLKGNLPFGLLSDEKTTKPIPLNIDTIEPGNEFKIENFTVKVLKTKKEMGSTTDLKFEFQRKDGLYQIDDLVFLDSEGNPIDEFKARMFYREDFNENDQTRQMIAYLFYQKYDKVQMSVKYRKIENKSIPVDAKFNLSVPQ